MLGLVYAADLMNVAGAARGLFFRRPDPGAVARAIAGGLVRIVPLALPVWGRNWRGDLAADIAGRLSATMQARREVPTQLDSLPEGIPGPLHVAWLETVDDAGAWDAEFGPAAGASAASR